MCGSMAKKIVKSEDEWRRELTPEQFAVCRDKGTERAFTGRYWDHHEAGAYRCSACGAELFDAATKFDSGTGWPSFWQPIDESQIETEDDTSHGTRRTEVMCAACGAHLGHVFPDGPRPTGLRYCINSVSLDFDKKKE
jgi:peptide-methionine (R)-S-oxide reductase